MSNCKVWLDNYQGQYFPGSLIQGKFVCNLDSESPLRCVKVRIIGSEHTEFFGQQSNSSATDSSNRNETVNFIGNNDFLNHEIILYGTAGQNTQLAQGQHIYPFSFNLPHNLPSSFNCPRGSIFYKVHGIVDRPMRTDFEDQFVFIVQAPIDLNKFEQSPDLLGPSHYSEEKTVCCFCCASGPISMDVELPKKAAIIGETVILNVRLSNHSNVNVDSLKVVLKQTLKFLADNPQTQEQEESKDLAQTSDVGLGAHGEHLFKIQLTIPPETFIPNFDQCKLFKCTNFYEIRAVLPSYHRDLVVKIEPVIGNIAPGTSQGYAPPQGPPSGPVQGQYPGSSPQGYPQMGFQTGPGGYPILDQNAAPNAPPSYDSVKPQ